MVTGDREHPVIALDDELLRPLPMDLHRSHVLVMSPFFSFPFTDMLILIMIMASIEIYITDISQPERNNLYIYIYIYGRNKIYTKELMELGY